MKTIFDYNPTTKELEAIGFDSLMTLIALPNADTVTKEIYLEKVPEDKSLFDIALLHECRGLDASSFWSQIPDLYNEYKMMLNCNVMIPVDE